MKKIICILYFLFHCQFCLAADLIEVYRDALGNDPIYKAIEAKTLADKEIYPQARAGLLPAIIATADVSRNHAYKKLFPDEVPNYYGTHNYLVTLDQPLFNYTSIKEFQRSKAIVKQAAANLRAAQQDLVLRTAKAYFDVLIAQDNLRFTQGEKKAVGRQLEQAKQRYNVGLDAITSVYDAQATYDAVVAREISDQNDIINQFENLRKITGRIYPSIAHIKTTIPLLKPDPTRVESWVSSAERYNSTLQAFRYAADAAKENIGAAAGGGLPTVNIVTNYSNFNPIQSGFTGHDHSSAGVGLALNFPVFQSGLVMSQTRQAKYSYEQALSDLEANYRNATVSTRQFYNNVISGISIVQADRQTVISATSSVESNEAAYQVGTRTIIDVLLVQNRLYDAQRQLASDQYTYINDVLALKNAAGTLSTVDLEEVNTWLNATTANTTMERYKVSENKLFSSRKKS